MNDLYISTCSEEPVPSNASFYTMCSNWGFTGDTHSITFFTNKTNRDLLYNNILPGKVEQWDIPFTKTLYFDSTFISANTVYIKPVAGTQLSSIRDEIYLVVKDYKEELIGRPANTFKITLTGYEASEL